MRFIVKKSTVKESEIDVDLPCYSRHNLDNNTIYHKLGLNNDGDLFILTLDLGDSWRSGEQRIIMTVRPVNSTYLGQDGDYYLGRGEFGSSEDEWKEALGMVSKMLAKFGRYR